MEYKDIQKVNESLSAMDIKGKNYITVNERIKAFRQLYPEGTIETEILSLEGGVVTIKATVKNIDVILGTGHAQEKESSSYINKTSYIENCETSAVGRALGMLGIGIDTSFASYEEVVNAQLNQSKEIEERKKAADKYAAASRTEKISKAHLYDLANKIAEFGLNAEYIKKCLKVDNFNDLSEKDYYTVINNIDMVKEKGDKYKESENG
jgi:hypothetical protein